MKHMGSFVKCGGNRKILTAGARKISVYPTLRLECSIDDWLMKNKNSSLKNSMLKNSLIVFRKRQKSLNSKLRREKLIIREIVATA